MNVRTILVPVTGTDEGLACNEAAFKLGAHLGAHVEGLHARRDARDALAYIGEGMTGAMIDGVGVNSKPNRVPYRPERMAARDGAQVPFAE